MFYFMIKSPNSWDKYDEYFYALFSVSFLLEIMSALYLAYAIYHIRKRIKSLDKESFNIKQMIIHAASFSFYIFGVVFGFVCRFFLPDK